MRAEQMARWHRGVTERTEGHGGLTLCWRLKAPYGLTVATLVHISGTAYEYLILGPPRHTKTVHAIIDGVPLEDAINEVEQVATDLGWNVSAWANLNPEEGAAPVRDSEGALCCAA